MSKEARIAALRAELLGLEGRDDASKSATLANLEASINTQIAAAASLAREIDGRFTVRMENNEVTFDGYSWDGLAYNNDWYSSSMSC